MFFAILAGLACVFAGVFQLLALKHPFGERRILRIARRITAVAMLSAGVYILYALIYEVPVPVILCWVSGLFSLGQFLFAMNTFMEPECAERLMDTTKQYRRRNESHA